MFPSGERSLDPRIIWVWIASGVGRTVVAIMVASSVALGLAPELAGPIVGAVAASMLTWAVLVPVLRFRSWSIRLADHHLVIRRGILWRRERLVPRSRVQHVDVSSGPLDRAFGLRQVSVFTAGSRGADVGIPGLSPTDAESLRRALVGDPDDAGGSGERGDGEGAGDHDDAGVPHAGGPDAGSVGVEERAESRDVPVDEADRPIGGPGS